MARGPLANFSSGFFFAAIIRVVIQHTEKRYLKRHNVTLLRGLCSGANNGCERKKPIALRFETPLSIVHQLSATSALRYYRR